MREGIVIILGDNEDINTVNQLHIMKADLVIQGDRILKNRYGKYGNIVYDFESPVEGNLRMGLLLDIWEQITKRKDLEHEI